MGRTPWKVLAIIRWAWIPLCWQPLWGQAPGVRVEPSSDKKQQTKLGATQSQADQRGTQNAPIIVDVLRRPKSEQEAAEEKREKERKALIDGWTLGIAAAVATFTGALVIVGFYGVRAANRTLSQIRRQTKATQQGIQHVVNSERAWLVLTPDPGFELKPGLGKLDWKIWNRGKSIARIIEGQAFTEIKGPGFRYRPFEQVMELKEPIPFHKVPVAPDLFVDVWCMMIDANGLTGDAFDDIKNRGRELLAYGYVRYIDAFENERESRFAYYFAPSFNGFRIDFVAPEEYHRCT